MKYRGFEQEEFLQDRIWIRLTQGKYGPNDKKLWVNTMGWDLPHPDGWRVASDSLLFIMADFIGQCEEHRYPQSRGKQGWRFPYQRVYTAIHSGWRKAWELTQRERANREQRSGKVESGRPEGQTPP